MKIEKRSQENLLGSHTGEWCIFVMSHEFYGLDYSDNAVILVNARGKFVVGKKYKNCISLGSGYVAEHNTIEEAMIEANRK